MYSQYVVQSVCTYCSVYIHTYCMYSQYVRTITLYSQSVGPNNESDCTICLTFSGAEKICRAWETAVFTCVVRRYASKNVTHRETEPQTHVELESVCNSHIHVYLLYSVSSRWLFYTTWLQRWLRLNNSCPAAEKGQKKGRKAEKRQQLKVTQLRISGGGMW